VGLVLWTRFGRLTLGDSLRRTRSVDYFLDLLWGPALGTRFRGLTFRGLALWDLFYVTRFGCTFRDSLCGTSFVVPALWDLF
jgi:hypothetical protein